MEKWILRGGEMGRWGEGDGLYGDGYMDRWRWKGEEMEMDLYKLWRDEEMEIWSSRYVEMERWRNGEMEKWRGRKMEKELRGQRKKENSESEPEREGEHGRKRAWERSKGNKGKE